MESRKSFSGNKRGSRSPRRDDNQKGQRRSSNNNRDFNRKDRQSSNNNDDFNDKGDKKPFTRKKANFSAKPEKNFKSKSSDSDKRVRKPFVKKDDSFNDSMRKSFEKNYNSPYKPIRKNRDNDDEFSERPRKRTDNKDDSFNSSMREGFNKKNNSPKKIVRKNKDDVSYVEKKGKSIDNKGNSFKEKPSRSGKIVSDIKKRFEGKEIRPQRNKIDEGIRLNKFIAKSGICSRREADEYITQGLVEVNGVIVTELGTKVSESDVIKCNSSYIKPERKVYILLNKPKDYATTTDDPYAKKTVMDIIGNACKERVYPVGRLDKASTGVLLLTNDGDLTKLLTHPKQHRKKVYHVTLDKSITQADMIKLAEGFELEDGFTNVDEISYISQDTKKEVGIEIHSGKNRIIRRMMEHLGYDVRKLDRVYFAGLTKKGLTRGKWRFLTEKEVAFLRMGNG